MKTSDRAIKKREKGEGKEEDQTTVLRTYVPPVLLHTCAKRCELEARLYDANGLISKALKRG